MSCDLESEPYGPRGNMAGEGVLGLLGRPSTDQLNTCIRESVQNAWDARQHDATPSCLLRLRCLEGRALDVLRHELFSQIPAEPEGPLRELASLESLTVLEIADFGTTGLGGPTDPSEVTDRTRDTDFVNFFRNLGTPRDTAQGGGTYGYGKSSLYAISRYQTVLADTCADVGNGQVERRLMACRIGPHYSADRPEGRRGYTGRHWWGRFDRNQYVQPLTGRDADVLADGLGLPPRSDARGTTFAILEPMLPDMTEEDLRQVLVDSVLWNFWPKLVEHQGRIPMGFRIDVFGREVPIPAPDESAPFHLFAEALRDVRARSDSCSPIMCGRPRRLLGWMSLRKFLRADRGSILRGEEQIIPDTVHHVALMRPAELVVRYIEGIPLQDPDHEWAGVFVCSDEPEVEEAFARSEPPAHDDWLPNYLPHRSREKTFVNVALKRIREVMRDFNGPAPRPAPGEAPPLAAVADRLGAMLAPVEGDRPGGGQPPRPPRPGPGPRRRIRVSTPEFTGLEEDGDRVLGVFEITVNGYPDAVARVEARPLVVLEGNSSADVAPNGRAPRIVRWTDGGRRVGEHDDSLQFRMTAAAHVLRVAVVFPDYVAVRLTASASEAADQHA